MSQVFTKLQEIESQIDSEIRQVDRQIKDLRQIEILRLNVNDIDLEQKPMLVRGKGADDQELVDLHPNTVDALNNYLKRSRKKSGALFTSDSNNSKNKRFTTRSIRQIVKNFLH